MSGEEKKKNRPVATLSCGNIKAAVWEKLMTNGSVLRSYSFQKSYKTATGYGNTAFFNLGDLAALVTLLFSIMTTGVKIKSTNADGTQSDVLTEDPAMNQEAEPTPF